MTIQEFCDKHGACADGKSWALKSCKDMAEVWAKAKPEWLLWVATRPGVLSDKDLRLFACRCVRKVWHLLTDDRSKRAVEVAESFAEGKATIQELSAASAAAWDAARAASAAAIAASAAAWGAWDAASAAWDAARGATRDAAMGAAMGADWDAARGATRDAAMGAAMGATWGDARADQALMLREYEPNFEEVKA